MNPSEIARAITAVLGEENIESATHCMTRLRLHLKEQNDHKREALKKIPGVLGVNMSGEELQVVLGPGRAAAVTEVLCSLLSQSPPPAPTAPSAPPAAPAPRSAVGHGQALRETLRVRNATPVKLLFKRITNIFLPLIPAFIACGLLTGLLNIFLRFFPVMGNLPIVQLLYVAGNTAFYGLNLLVGWNTAKEAGGSPALGAILAALISHPQLAAITLWDVPLIPGRGGVIAVLFIASAGAWLEKHLHRLVPEILDLFLTPLLVLLVTGTAAIFLLQPIGGWVSEGISCLTAAAIGKGGGDNRFSLRRQLASHRNAGTAPYHDAHSCRTSGQGWRYRPSAGAGHGGGWTGRCRGGRICKNEERLPQENDSLRSARGDDGNW